MNRIFLVFAATATITVSLCAGCTVPKPISEQDKYQAFYSQTKAVVKSDGKFFINDIPKGEVKK